MGPQKQLRMMFDPVRLYATAVYVGCVVLALIFALWVRIFELFLFFLSHGLILFFFHHGQTKYHYSRATELQ
jgi:hypothetical protein